MDLYTEAQALMPVLVEMRKHFHMHPEPSGHEKETAAKVREYLEQFGYSDIKTGVSGHGVIATLMGDKDGPVTALRADMDALQIEEQSGLPFASVNRGLMHACGHDTHMTMVLGAARLIAGHRDELKGGVRLIFQPREEFSPLGGAKGMIEEGALEGVDRVFGLHVWPELPAGVFGCKHGALMASTDHFFVYLDGRSSHGAEPHKGVDAVVAGAQVVTAVQSIMSRNCDPLESAVVSIGRFAAGTRYNIVAERCELEGTIRTFSPGVQEICERRFRDIVTGVGSAMGCKVTVDYERGYQTVMNTPGMSDLLLDRASRLFGAEAAVEVKRPSTCAEDFSAYLGEKPGAFAWLGVAEEGREVYPLHNARMVPPDMILPRGSALLADLALEI